MLHDLDSDSSKIIEAVRSTGVVVTEAMRLYVDYIVSNMKAIGTWQLCTAVYGIVGGTASSHAINWKTIGTYTLAYGGGTINHTSTGMKFNSNGYATTGLSPATISSSGLISFGMYTNSTTTAIDGYDIGAWGNSGYTVLNLSPTFVNFLSPYATGNTQLNVVRSFSKGFYQVTQDGLIKGYINGGKQTGTYSYPASGIPNISIYIGAADGNGIAGQFTDRQYCFDFFSSPLTDTQAQQQSQIVTNAQLILNRA